MAGACDFGLRPPAFLLILLFLLVLPLFLFLPSPSPPPSPAHSFSSLLFLPFLHLFVFVLHLLIFLLFRLHHLLLVHPPSPPPTFLLHILYSCPSGPEVTKAVINVLYILILGPNVFTDFLQMEFYFLWEEKGPLIFYCQEVNQSVAFIPPLCQTFGAPPGGAPGCVPTEPHCFLTSC